MVNAMPRYWFCNHYDIEIWQLVAMPSKGFSYQAFEQVSIHRPFEFLFPYDQSQSRTRSLVFTNEHSIAFCTKGLRFVENPPKLLAVKQSRFTREAFIRLELRLRVLHALWLDVPLEPYAHRPYSCGHGSHGFSYDGDCSVEMFFS